MARLPYVEQADDARVASAFQTAEAQYGRVSNMFRLAANAPWLVPGIAELSVAVTAGDPEGLDAEMKRLVNLAVSIRNSCSYCAQHNSVWAEESGASSAKVEALLSERIDLETFSAAERAAICWARSVAANAARRDVEGYAELEKHFTLPQIAELTILASHRTMINLMQEAFWADLEGSEASDTSSPGQAF